MLSNGSRSPIPATHPDQRACQAAVRPKRDGEQRPWHMRAAADVADHAGAGCGQERAVAGRVRGVVPVVHTTGLLVVITTGLQQAPAVHAQHYTLSELCLPVAVLLIRLCPSVRSHRRAAAAAAAVAGAAAGRLVCGGGASWSGATGSSSAAGSCFLLVQRLPQALGPPQQRRRHAAGCRQPPPHVPRRGTPHQFCKPRPHGRVHPQLPCSEGNGGPDFSQLWLCMKCRIANLEGRGPRAAAPRHFVHSHHPCAANDMT